MKKVIWTAIAALILTAALGTGAGVNVSQLLTSAEEVAETENAIESGLESTVPIRGDLNGDEEVTSADLAYLRRYLAGWQGYEVEDQTKFDLDGDGQITGSDVTMLRRYLAEWEVHPEETYTDGLTFELSADGKSYAVTGYESSVNAKMRLMRASEGETLVIPSYYHGLPVTEVKKEVFEALPSVTELTVGDNIATIPDKVKNLTSLTRLTIGNSVESVDVSGYQNLKEVLVSGNNQTYSTQNGVLFDKEKTELIAYPQGKEDQSYKVPETVTAIGENAFAGNKQLKNVTMSDAVERIGANAFANTGIDDIRLPNNENLTTAETSFINTKPKNIYFTGTKDEWIAVKDKAKIRITTTDVENSYYCFPEEELTNCTHKWDEGKTVIVKEATVYDKGITSYICTVCRVVKEETIPKKESFSVIFIDNMGNVVSERIYEIGTTKKTIEEQQWDSLKDEYDDFAGYHLKGWYNGETSFENFSFPTKREPGEVFEFHAEYEKQFIVKFIDYEGKQIGNSKIVYESSNYIDKEQCPKIPDRTGYTADWNPSDLLNICSDKVITPVYRRKEYTVTFHDRNGKEIKEQKVLYEDSAIPPDLDQYYLEDNNDMKVFEFTGWKEDITKITENVDVHPCYEKYDAPVIAVKLIKLNSELNSEDKKLSLSIIMPNNTDLLYSVNLAFNWTVKDGICRITGKDTVNATSSNLYKDYCKDDRCTVNKNTGSWVTYNNKIKSFSFIWNCGNGHKFNFARNVITLTFSVNGGAEFNKDIFNLSGSSAVVFGDGDGNIANITKIRPLIYFYE